MKSKYTLYLVIASMGALASVSTAATVNPQVDYGQAAVTTSFFTNSSDGFFGAGEAFIFYGTFSALPTALSTAQEIENDFRQLGISTDVYDSGHTFTGDVESTEFESQRGYLVAANNADIGQASEIAIVSNSALTAWTFADDLTGTPAADVINMDDVAPSAGGAEIILGTRGTGSFDTIRMVTLVPEPSSVTLLGLGAAAFLFRRKK